MISEVKAVAGAVRRFRKTPCATARLRRPDRGGAPGRTAVRSLLSVSVVNERKRGRALHAPPCCILPALRLMSDRRLGPRSHRLLVLPATERLHPELGELLRLGTVVLLHPGPQQRRQPPALRGDRLDLLRRLLLARLEGRLLRGDVNRLGEQPRQLGPRHLQVPE